VVPGAPIPVFAPDLRQTQGTTNSTADPGAAGGTPAPEPAPGSDVSSTETGRGSTTNPARAAHQLGETGDGTRRLIILGGIAMLLGAVVIGFSSRDEPRAATPTVSAAVAAAAARRRQNRPRRGELFGWDESVPLNPGRREVARRRAGLTADYAEFSAGSSFDDEPGA